MLRLLEYNPTERELIEMKEMLKAVNPPSQTKCPSGVFQFQKRLNRPSTLRYPQGKTQGRRRGKSCFRRIRK